METLKFICFYFCALFIGPLAPLFLQLLALFLVASMMKPDFRLWLLDAMETEINIFTFFFFLNFLLYKCISNNAWHRECSNRMCCAELTLCCLAIKCMHVAAALTKMLIKSDKLYLQKKLHD